MTEHAEEREKPKGIVIFIDKKQFTTEATSLTGAQIRGLPQPPIGADRDLYEEVPGKEDVLVADSQSIKLKDGMHFFTTPHTINPGC